LYRFLEVKISDGEIHPKCFYPLASNEKEAAPCDAVETHTLTTTSSVKVTDADAFSSSLHRSQAFDDVKRHPSELKIETGTALEASVTAGCLDGGAAREEEEEKPSALTDPTLCDGNKMHGGFVADRAASSPSLSQSRTEAAPDKEIVTPPEEPAHIQATCHSSLKDTTSATVADSNDILYSALNKEAETSSFTERNGIDNDDIKVIITEPTTAQNGYHNNNNNNITARSSSQESIRPDVIEAAICSAVISTKDITQIISHDDALYEKYEYFTFMKANPDARECPKCKHLQIGSPGSPEMTCNDCSYVYCYFHSASHPNSTCAAFETAIAPEMVSICIEVE
jgi:hypothetical protein